MGADCACILLFCAAKRCGAFPPNMPAVLSAVLRAALPHRRKPAWYGKRISDNLYSVFVYIVTEFLCFGPYP